MTHPRLHLALLFTLLSSLFLAPSLAAQALGVATRVEPLEIVVNLPAYRVDLLENGEVRASYPVGIGTPRFPTPTGSHQVRRIVWNPSWHPPASAWARKEKPQGPGPRNPMGRAKILLSGLYYFHGTPEPHTVGRTGSHGCLRMRNQDVIALARLLFELRGGMSREAIDQALAQPRRTREALLGASIPARVVYELAEVRQDTLILHPDVYGYAREGRLAHARRALSSQGISWQEVDEAALAGRLGSARERVHIPLGEIRTQAALGTPTTLPR